MERKEKTKQGRKMRETWDVLCGLKSTLQMGERGVEEGKLIKELGIYELEQWQIESLVSPSPPVEKPEYMPIVNYFTVSPWKSEMCKIRFCHSRGIQVRREGKD